MNMKIKIFITFLVIAWGVIFWGLRENSLLMSSILGNTDTCSNSFLAKTKLNYQNTLFQVRTIESFLVENNCQNKESENTVCARITQEKSGLEKILHEYDLCREKLHKSSELVENVSTFVPPAWELKKWEFGFWNPGFTALGTDKYTGYRLGDSILWWNWIIFGTSFTGGIYQHIMRTDTILRTYFDGNQEIIDSSFYGKLPETPLNISSVQEYADKSIYVLYWSSDPKYAPSTWAIGANILKLVKLKPDGSYDPQFPVIENISRLDYTFKFTSNKRLYCLFGDGYYGYVDLDTGSVYKSKTVKSSYTAMLIDDKIQIQRVNVLWTQSDGKLIVETDQWLFRFDENLNLDTTFNPVTKVTYELGKDAKCDVTGPEKYTILPDDSLIVTGKFTHIEGIPRNCIARLTPDGKLDKKFNPGSSFSFRDQNWYLLILPDSQKKLLVQGNFTGYQDKKFESQIYFNTTRLNLDGTIDSAFTIKNTENQFLTRATTQAFNLRDGKILTVNSGEGTYSLLSPDQVYDASSARKLDTEWYTDEELDSSWACHKDDFSRWMYKVGQKIYIPFSDVAKQDDGKSSILVYNINTMRLLKKIRRDDEYIPPEGLGYDLIENRGVRDGKYLYIWSASGVDIIDTEKDEIRKTILFRNPDESSNSYTPPTELPSDTISTFEYNGETYVIRSDRVIYKLIQNNTPPVKKEKYITLHPGAHTPVSHEISQRVYVNVMQKIGDDIYVVARDRMIVIDTKTQQVSQETTWGDTRRINFDHGPLFFANNKIYTFNKYRNCNLDDCLHSLNVQVFDTIKRGVIKTLENHQNSTVTNAQNGSNCPIPYWVDRVFIDKDIIYIYADWNNQNSLITKNIGKCDIMRLDTQNDTFSPVTHPTEEIINNLLLAQNNVSNGIIGFRYNNTYLIPASSDDAYTLVDGTSFTKKWSTTMRPLTNLVPKMQYGKTLYYNTPGFTINIQKLDIGNDESCVDK